MKIRAIFVGLLFTFMMSTASAGFPTVEVGPQLIQNILQRIQQAQQLYEEIEARKTQNQQYKMNVKDFSGPQQYVWAQPSGNIREMLGLTNELKSLKDYASAIQTLVEKYKTYKEYSSTPCLVEGDVPCNENDRQQLAKMIDEANAMSSDQSRSSSNGMVKLLERQKMTLQSDADKLQKLERNATTPEGRNAALSYMNQFSSQQGNQLLQIRALMIAQQNTIVMQMKAEQAEIDMRKAGDNALLKGSRFVPNKKAPGILSDTALARPK